MHKRRVPNSHRDVASTLDPDLERELLRAYIDSANDGIFVVCEEMKFHVDNPLLVE